MDRKAKSDAVKKIESVAEKVVIQEMTKEESVKPVSKSSMGAKEELEKKNE